MIIIVVHLTIRFSMILLQLVHFRNVSCKETVMHMFMSLCFCMRFDLSFLTVGFRAQKYTAESDTRTSWIENGTEFDNTSEWNLSWNSVPLSPPYLFLLRMYLGKSFALWMYQNKFSCAESVLYLHCNVTDLPSTSVTCLSGWLTSSSDLHSVKV